MVGLFALLGLLVVSASAFANGTGYGQGGGWGGMGPGMMGYGNGSGHMMDYGYRGNNGYSQGNNAPRNGLQQKQSNIKRLWRNTMNYQYGSGNHMGYGGQGDHMGYGGQGNHMGYVNPY